jgi:hypothetical protein
MQIS